MSDVFGRGDLTPEELRQLLRAMPRASAPDDLEHQLLTRIAILRRAGAVSVAAARPRPDIRRGVLASVIAGLLFALGWVGFSDLEQTTAPTAPQRATAPSATATPASPSSDAAPASPEPLMPAATAPETTSQAVTGERPTPRVADPRAAVPSRPRPVERAVRNEGTVDDPATVEEPPAMSTPSNVVPNPVEHSLTGGHTDTAPGP